MNRGHTIDPAALPLANKAVLVTRPLDQAEEFSRLLAARGATVVSLPSIRIVPPSSWEECDRAIGILDSYDAIVFTSANAVRYFVLRLNLIHAGKLPDSFRTLAFYVIGQKTGDALREVGISPTIQPAAKDSMQLADALLSAPHEGKRFLFPRGSLASEDMVMKLRDGGVQIDDVTVYQTVAPDDDDMLAVRRTIEEGAIHVVTFFSPSSFRNLVARIPPGLISRMTIAVIGEQTESAVRETGMQVQIVPDRPTSADLADAIVRYYTINERSL
jgi:uroporphyrinogen III methyltransferase / synthase